jgi:hypothetical protein
MMPIALQVLQTTMRHCQISMLDNVNLLRLENGDGYFGPSDFRLAGTGVRLVEEKLLERKVAQSI